MTYTKPMSTYEKSQGTYEGNVHDYPRDNQSPDTPSHAGNGDNVGTVFDRNRLADTLHMDASQRLLMQNASLGTNASNGECLTNSDSIGGSDFGINSPIGGKPNPEPNAGDPC